MSHNLARDINADLGIERLRFSGDWLLGDAARLEALLAREDMPRDRALELDLSGLAALDTSGGWLIVAFAKRLQVAGVRLEVTGLPTRYADLFSELERHKTYGEGTGAARKVRSNPLVSLGQSVVHVAQDGYRLFYLFGQVMAGIFGRIRRPSTFRATSVVHHLERTALRAVPIVFLMSFVIGAIIAQQGAFQLRKFGADLLVIDMVGILVLREVGVLLTAIMVAGRSGSAFTAEIGSMGMNEEVDAMRVIGLDPIDVLVLPRVLALSIAVPLLTIISNFAALLGAGVVLWVYIGVTPDAYIGWLREAVALNTFVVGMIKAPFMALIIALISCSEGFSVRGSAEELGRRTTASVVKSIFMVIVVDGILAMFFTAIQY